MASRESQGLQIALILFVMITVVLAVTSFVFYRQADEAKKTAKAATEAQKTAKTAMDNMGFWNDYLKHILGASPLAEAEFNVLLPSVEGDPEMAAIHAKYTQDMVTYGEGLLPEQRTYSNLPQNVLMAVQKLNSANTDLSLHNARLGEEKKQVTDTEKQRADEATKNMQKAKDELAQMTQQFNEDRTALETKQQEQFVKFQRDTAQQTQELKKRDDTIVARDTEVKKLQQTVGNQTNRIKELLDEPFEVPDGRIVVVNQATGTVWVNLGLADGLRRQTMFSVYDHEALNVAPGPGQAARQVEGEEPMRKIDERKGKIEVTRVLDQHLAEARILEDWPDDPIMPNDQVFSPAWKPGRKTGFALAGFMDIDGDGVSDRDRIRTIIAMNGGRIDAEVHDDGTVEGELTPTTRYLVRGEAPDGSNDTLLSAYSALNGQADDLGVEKKDFLTVLDMMGYKAEVRTVGLGAHADPLQFKALPEEGRARTSTGNVSEGFKVRRPRKAGASGS